MGRTTTQILLLPLAQEGLFDDMYNVLCSQISEKYTIIRKTTVDDAYKFLASSKPAAVLAADGGVALGKNNHLQQSLVRYTKAGGTVIFGCLFSSFVRPLDLQSLFEKFNLDWKSGDYHRTTFSLNEAVKPIFGEQVYERLEKSYSMKCLHLKNTPAVARVYVPTESSRTASMVFAPEAVDQQQCPAVLHKYGEGFVGYIGDVNNEEGSQALTLAMLEIAVQNHTSPAANTTQLPSSTSTNPGCSVCGTLTPALKCTACRQTQYCSSACQRADWKSHKEVCNRVVSPTQ